MTLDDGAGSVPSGAARSVLEAGFAGLVDSSRELVSRKVIAERVSQLGQARAAGD